MNWWFLSTRLVPLMAPPFFMALGVTLGGGLLGAWGHWLAGHPNMANAPEIAFRIRIWAVAVAIGGTITAFEHFERSLATRAVVDLARDGLILIAAYAGAEMGYGLLVLVSGA